jgi:hypothetical protein
VSRRSFFQRIDDWMNPIVVKELRQAVQSKLVVAVLVMFLFLQILILGFTLLTSEARLSPGELSFREGRSLFGTLQAILLGACMLVPVYVGVRLAMERSDTNVDLLFISTLKPRQIVFGKFLSGVVLVLLIFSACAPFLTFTYLLRGIDIPTILFILGVDFVLALWGVAATIFVAVIPATLIIRLVLGLLSLIGLGYLFAAGWGITFMALNFGLFIDVGMMSWQFWGPMLLGLLSIAGICGLFFSWSIAILHPPAANKAWQMRLCVLAYVVSLGVASYLVSDALNHYGPFASWFIFAVLLSSLQLFISVNERDHIGPRIKRAIPRNRLLRMAAWLLYSGSAGGVAFSTLLLLGTMGTALLVMHFRGDLDGYLTAYYGMAPGRMPSGWQGQGEMLEFVRASFLIGMYTYCYCMTAVVLRTLVLRSQLRPGFTWLISLLLLGLGCVGPVIVMYLFFPDQGYGQRYGEDYSVMATNPFDAIDRSTRRYETFDRDIFDTDVTALLAVWAAAVSVGAMPWLFGQLKRFIPLSRSGKRAREVPMVVADTPATTASHVG